MSIIKGYSSSDSDSDNEASINYADLKDPLENAALIPLADDARKNNSEHQIANRFDQYQQNNFVTKKRRFNAIIVPQEYDSAAFDIKHKSYLLHGHDDGVAGLNNKNDSNSIQHKKQKRHHGITSRKGKDPFGTPSGSEDITDSNSEYSSSSESTDNDGSRKISSKVGVVANQITATTAETGPKFSTKFYGKNEHDYLGRTYMHVPQDLNINLLKESGSQECFIPKKPIFTWNGHSGGVNKLQFFPNSGHLLLSGGNDGNIFIHDTFHQRELLRGYFGHKRSVKDLDFSKNNNGKTFASCGFDKMISVWDTETGTLVTNFKVKAIPNTLKFNPKNENELLVGLSNNNIEHFDIRAAPNSSDHLIQTYDHHLDSINSLTFISEDSKFLSTSDDKSVRIWELGINIPIKFISDPTQFSMPRSKEYPTGKYFATQAMNNKIMVYQAHEKFRQNKKKVFEGHDVSGYGIDFTFSPDGKIVMSGGSTGKAYFWDWKTTKLLKSYQVDRGIINCIEAHPQESSKVAMAGASGKIFYWE